MTNVTMPFLAEGVDKASISYWYHKIGELVKEGEDLVELITDKATFNMPSPITGTLKAIIIEEGCDAKVGDTIAIIE